MDTFDPLNVILNTEFEFNGVLNVNKHVSAVSELTNGNNNNMYNIDNTRSSHATNQLHSIKQPALTSNRIQNNLIGLQKSNQISNHLIQL